jgi:phage shock protein C
MVAGVCGGLGAYFGVDATVIRIVYLVLALATAGFPFLLLYICAALIIPLEPGTPGDMTIDVHSDTDQQQ